MVADSAENDARRRQVCFICGKPRQPDSEWCADHTETAEKDAGLIAAFRAWRKRCRVDEEWCGYFIGRRWCATHEVRWDNGGPCPARPIPPAEKGQANA